MLGVRALNRGNAGMREAVVERGKGGTPRPMDQARWPMPPEPSRQLLRAADDAAMVLIGGSINDAQDLQHRVGEVRSPAAGAEADLPEKLACPERAAKEPAACDEPVKA